MFLKYLYLPVDAPLANHEAFLAYQEPKQCAHTHEDIKMSIYSSY
jgi:hypothetical protein